MAGLHLGGTNVRHIQKVFNVVQETLKCTTIVDEYLISHKFDSNSETDSKNELLFTPPKRPKTLGLSLEEDEYVPTKKDKAFIRQSWAMLEFHENITHELPNPIVFWKSMTLRDVKTF